MIHHLLYSRFCSFPIKSSHAAALLPFSPAEGACSIGEVTSVHIGLQINKTFLLVHSDDGFCMCAGLIQVWILLLEQLTAAVSNCPRQHQPPTLELLFELLREVTKIPGQTPVINTTPNHTAVDTKENPQSPGLIRCLFFFHRAWLCHLLCHPASSSCHVTVATAKPR